MPAPHGDRRLYLVVGFAVVLFGAQLAAFGRQLAAGYRPFGPPPVRVALSWDMFATHIERCDVRWDPPLPIGNGLARFADLAKPFEWFPVYDRIATYRNVALAACARVQQPTRITLRCWLPDGTRPRQELRCR